MISQFLQAPHLDKSVIIILDTFAGKALLYKDKGYTHIVGYCDDDWTKSHTVWCSTFRCYVLNRANIIYLEEQEINVIA